MNPLQEMLKELKDREIHIGTVATGTVFIEDAEDILQTLEIKILNQYGKIPTSGKRVSQPVPQDKARIIAVAEELPSGNSEGRAC